MKKVNTDFEMYNISLQQPLKREEKVALVGLVILTVSVIYLSGLTTL